MKTNLRQSYPKSRVLDGRIVSAKTTNTVILEVKRVVRHPVYKKTIYKTRRLAAHNTVLGLAPGDMVRIAESRPISRTKHWRVVAKLK